MNYILTDVNHAIKIGETVETVKRIVRSGSLIPLINPWVNDTGMRLLGRKQIAAGKPVASHVP